MNPNNNDSQIRTWAMFCHLSSLLGLVLPFIGLPIPFANLLGPLGIWLYKKDQHPFINIEGKEAVNFQISVTIYSFLGFIALVIFAVIYLFLILLASGRQSSTAPSLLVFGTLVGGWLIAMLVVINLTALILVIVAALKAKKGEHYRYPFTLRFLQ